MTSSNNLSISFSIYSLISFRCTLDIINEILRKNESHFSGYLVVADDMIILPNRIAKLDRKLSWMNNIRIGSLETGEYLKFQKLLNKY